MKPPYECATTTYGPSIPAVWRSRWSSSASDVEVMRVPFRRDSLTPVPARSYVQTREIAAIGSNRSAHVSSPDAS